MKRSHALVALLILAALGVVLWRVLEPEEANWCISPDAEIPTMQPPGLPQAGSLADPAREMVAVPDSPAGARPQLRVEVRAGQDDAPLSNAEIFLSDNLIGATDEQGSFSAPWPAQVSSGVLIVSLAGYVSWEAEVVPQADSFRVTLVRTGVIRGRLVSADGNTGWEGMSVLAHPEDMTADRAVVGAALAAGNPAVQRVATDGSGWFDLIGLPADRKYLLYAGGPGWVSPQPLRNVAVDGLEVQLKMRKLFGIYMRYRGPDGGPLRVAQGLSQFPGGGISAPEHGTSEFVSPTSPGLLLLPFELPEAFSYSAWDRWMLYGLDLENQPALDAILTIPGYRPLRHTVTLRRVLHELPTEEFRLEPIQSDWGTVTITLAGLPPLAPDEVPTGSANSAPQIGLTFYPRNPPTAPYEELRLSPPIWFGAVVQDPRRGGVTIEGIPAGAYGVTWNHVLQLPNLPHQGFIPPQELIVVANQRTEVRLDLSATGALRIVAEAGAVPLHGPLLLELSLDPSDRVYQSWRDGPYLLYGLTPGLIHVKEGHDRRPAIPVLVEAGRFTEVRLPPP